MGDLNILIQRREGGGGGKMKITGREQVSDLRWIDRSLDITHIRILRV